MHRVEDWLSVNKIKCVLIIRKLRKKGFFENENGAWSAALARAPRLASRDDVRAGCGPMSAQGGAGARADSQFLSHFEKYYYSPETAESPERSKAKNLRKKKRKTSGFLFKKRFSEKNKRDIKEDN